MATIQDYESYCAGRCSVLFPSTPVVIRALPNRTAEDQLPLLCVSPVIRPAVEPVAFGSDALSPYGHYEHDYQVQITHIQATNLDNYSPALANEVLQKIITDVMTYRTGLPAYTYDVRVEDLRDFVRTRLHEGIAYTSATLTFQSIGSSNDPTLTS